LAALAAGLGRALAVLGEVARIPLGTTAAMAVLTALASGFCRTLAVIREIPGTVLPAKLAGTRSLLTIFREIARIAGVSLFRHLQFLLVE
jgi:hypothetical protein